MGSIALLVDGARLGAGEAAKHTESRNNVCVLSNYSRHERPASARRTKSSGRKEKEWTCIHFRT
jgi:hypothetical protein